MCLSFQIACTNLIFLFQICRLILCHSCILTNQFFKPFCQNAEFLLYFIPFLPQLPRPANAVNQRSEFRNYVLFDFHQGVQCFDENPLDFLFRQMPRAARLSLLGIFLVAAEDHSAILIRGVPHLRPVPTATAAAFDFVREDAHVAVLAVLLSAFYLRLDKIKQVRRDDRLVVLFHIILRNLARVLTSRLIQEVCRILFLNQRIAAILLVCEDGTHCGDVPLVLSRRGFDAPLFQFLSDGVEGSPAKEEFVDELYNFRLFLVDFEVLVISEMLRLSATFSSAHVSSLSLFCRNHYAVFPHIFKQSPCISN